MSPVLERLSELILRSDDCWLWQGKPNKDGYGQAQVDGNCWLAHRLIYTVEVGPIPDGLTLDHLCLVKMCVRPDHLEPVTQAVNNLRMMALRERPTHCKWGHSLDDAYDYGTQRCCRTCTRERYVRRRQQRCA